VPHLHGFLFNDKTVFLSLCRIRGGELVGAPNPYLQFDSPRRPSHDEAAVHFLKAFEEWFEYHWADGRPVWPT
jgi:hypothetical protein